MPHSVVVMSVSDVILTNKPMTTPHLHAISQQGELGEISVLDIKRRWLWNSDRKLGVGYPQSVLAT